ncbi:MAG: hypothetical protein JO060_01410 [Candidatus Eremiobacteraeota bacterium]|nr:hypothetical protein [Candidatus Eremiobacteraeota bacterium]
MAKTMSDIEYLQAQIPDFKGYLDEISRHQTDQRVRAWVGSTLADVQQRLAGKLEPDAAKALEATIFRCQFPDQIFTTRLDVADVDADVERGLAQADRALVELANRASLADAPELPAILSEFSVAFDRRRQRAPQPPEVEPEAVPPIS